jgi:hypothetical protein
MADELNSQRSRRALLAAAAGGAAALAATAAMPLTALADTGDPVIAGQANTADATTSLANSATGSDGFVATATGLGAGLIGSSTESAGVIGTSVDDTEAALRDDTVYTGVYGWAPTNEDPFGPFATGVWGDSSDVGVYGSGGTGLYGEGVAGVVGFGSGVGVFGYTDSPSAPGIEAYSDEGVALRVTGKVQFSRSGRKPMSSGKSNVVVTLAGSTKYSKIFAVLATSESGRWVRAVVPAAGKFTVYLNTTLTSSAVVSWFVID